MWDLNESSSFEEWLAALCKIDDISDFQKKNPDLLKKCPQELREFGYPEYGPIRANPMFWRELCDDKPELYEYFDWKEGLRLMEALVAKVKDPQHIEEDLVALDFLFHVFYKGFDSKSFSCSTRQWDQLERKVRGFCHDCIAADFFVMSWEQWASSKDFLELYSLDDDNFEGREKVEGARTLSEEDWRTLLERKPYFCKKFKLSPDDIASEAVVEKDLQLLKSAAGMGADLCSVKILGQTCFPRDCQPSMPIIRYLIEEKKIHEKMMTSDDEEKREYFFACIQGLAEKDNAYLAEYLISQAGDSKKEAIRAAMTGAARGLNCSSFIDLWENYQDITEEDEELRAAIAREVFAYRIDNAPLWNTCEILGYQNFELAEKDILPVMTKMLKATCEVMCSFCRNDHFPSENADIVEIARSIVLEAEILTKELK